MKHSDNGKPEDLFAINLDRLHEEWVNQPRLYYQAAAKLADLKEAFERAKAKRDVVAAEQDKAIRLTPSAYGLEKTTEPVIEKTICLQKDHRIADKEVISAKHAVDISQAVVDALDHRKKALEMLVQLRLASYFSTPRKPDAESLSKAERRAAFGGKKR